ncbi:MAG: DUF4363 family protein [Bacillota bacterium]|nr:DUF4363 family protein [Bacillota bacterium]
MKPVIISTACMLFLIASWGFFYWFSGVILNDFSDELVNTVYGQISREEWADAEESLCRLSERWETNKTVFYMLSNHSAVRETDVALARLSEFVRNKEASDANAEIAAVSELFLSIRQSEAFSIDNIL